MTTQPPLPPPPTEPGAQRPEIPPPPELGSDAAALHVAEMGAPGPSSRAPLVAGLLLVLALAVIVVAIGVWITRPAVCDETNVRSERFGYCFTAPQGWRVAEVDGDDVTFEQLFRPASAATLTIQAVDTSRDLDTFVSDLREMQREAGLDQGDITETEVAGVRARQWDSATTTDAGSYRVRDVVFVHDGIAWRLQFADATEAFDEGTRDLVRILRSWRFA
jgi:hypothetical protein